MKIGLDGPSWIWSILNRLKLKTKKLNGGNESRQVKSYVNNTEKTRTQIFWSFEPKNLVGMCSIVALILVDRFLLGSSLILRFGWGFDGERCSESGFGFSDVEVWGV